MSGVRKITPEDTFYDYFTIWVADYKEGVVRDATLQKYKMSIKWLGKLAPDLKLKDINRAMYQKILNAYAKEHEKQTTLDFHHHLKGAILDAVDEGLIERDPTRKAIVKGRKPVRDKKIKYLSKEELGRLLKTLELKNEVNRDYFIMLVAKTGLRFSEALAITPEDFDFKAMKLTVNKTWDYKHGGGFTLTKNQSSIRTIAIDWKLGMQMSELIKNLPPKEPIFVEPGKKIYNSTYCDFLARKCKEADVPPIGVHALRHTHASILLGEGATIASIAMRLGHSNIATTQKVYLHVIAELEAKDNNIIIGAMSGL